jgi:hypothetical protein
MHGTFQLQILKRKTHVSDLRAHRRIINNDFEETSPEVVK